MATTWNWSRCHRGTRLWSCPVFLLVVCFELALYVKNTLATYGHLSHQLAYIYIYLNLKSEISYKWDHLGTMCLIALNCLKFHPYYLIWFDFVSVCEIVSFGIYNSGAAQMHPSSYVPLSCIVLSCHAGLPRIPGALGISSGSKGENRSWTSRNQGEIWSSMSLDDFSCNLFLQTSKKGFGRDTFQDPFGRDVDVDVKLMCIFRPCGASKFDKLAVFLFPFFPQRCKERIWNRIWNGKGGRPVHVHCFVAWNVTLFHTHTQSH